MAVNTQDTRAFVGPIQEDVVRSDEFPARERFDAQAEDGAAVDSGGVRVLHFEGGDASASAVDAFFIMGKLCFGLREEGLLQWVEVGGRGG